jgi:2-polyprenyl-6-methoxyphenol hydroxylase-like FAD-dependent oxidoreductase
MNRTVLISGGGVAGLALAYWLQREGFVTTVIERSPELRSGGQAVDIRGVALDVVKAMGLHDAVDARRTRLRGMSIVDADGQEIERTEERTFSAGRLDSKDIEIFRDDLCGLLLNQTSEGVEYLYGDSITAIEQDTNDVAVSFRGQPDRRFDFVIGADGVYSNVPKLVFGDDASFVKPLGVTMPLFTTPNLIDLKSWQLAYRGEAVGYVIYPSFDQTQLRVGVGFGAEPGEISRNDMAAQKAAIVEKCKQLGGYFPELLDAMRDTSQFYWGELAQIHMPGWSQGRVALVGDAGYCASPFSGQGTSLALVGALVLAKALAQNPEDFSQAFAAYEQRMRPFVKLNQELVDPERRGHVPDDQLTAAKNGISLDDLLQA